MRLIGLHGRAGAGKDTVAAVLRADHDFAPLAFASPLKDMLAVLLNRFGLNRLQLEERAVKERTIDALGKSPRQMIQLLGTEWGRGMVHTDLWVIVADLALKQYRKFATGVVVTDVRYENEAAWVRSQGGEIWHVLRPHHIGTSAAHSSEEGIALLAGADSVVLNESDLDHLASEVRAAFAGERHIPQATA